MPAPCHQTHNETGLWFEIQVLKDVIASKKKRGIDNTFEKNILKSYRKYSEETYQRPLDKKYEAEIE